MPKDYSEILGALRETAIGRCRQRIDAAAKKVQGIVTTSPDDQKEGSLPCGGGEQYGVTSVLKKRHGL